MNLEKLKAAYKESVFLRSNEEVVKEAAARSDYIREVQTLLKDLPQKVAEAVNEYKHEVLLKTFHVDEFVPIPHASDTYSFVSSYSWNLNKGINRQAKPGTGANVFLEEFAKNKIPYYLAYKKVEHNPVSSASYPWGSYQGSDQIEIYLDITRLV
jgi:hypothetical protein